MSYLIVGSLLVLIIITAGWLIAFSSLASSYKEKVNDCQAVIERLFKKKEELQANADPVLIQPQLDELEEKLQLSCRDYNNAVSKYNQFLSSFPNSAAAMILGLKKLPFLRDDK